MNRASLLILPLLGALACSNATGSCNGTSPVRGQWSYRATREAPMQATITGSLLIEMRNCVDLQGSLDVVEVLPTGESRRIAGPVSGTVIDDGLVRFEAELGTAGREHFARFTGDSLTGTWIEVAGPAAGSGSFSGRRQATP
jgi:autotransporter translocation and assembly factor TamB